MSDQDVVEQLLQSIGMHSAAFGDDVARIQVHHNKVLGLHLVPGLHVEADEREDGIDAQIRVAAGARIAKPIHVCFGMLPESGLQHIVLDIEIGEEAKISMLAHCTFPNARQVVHKMDARIRVCPGADYAYLERHVHGPYGGVVVVPKADVTVHDNARFRTEFELIKGRCGRIEFDYLATCQANSVLEMVARLRGREDDQILLKETGRLVGEYSRAVLTSHIALQDNARAEVCNELTASANGARGHVDCKEIVQGNALARAVPIVQVNHPGAHVTHEAAIGSVDSKQLQTLMSRGLTEDQATNLIIEALLS